MITKLLMCRPDYYVINYSINSWTDAEGQIDGNLAMQQWENLYNTLIQLGVEVELLNPVEGIPDMCFVGDAGMAYNGKFIPSNFRHKERQAEIVHYVDWMKSHDYKVFNIPENISFEGLGDVVQYDDVYFIGYGGRSSQGACKYTSKVFEELKLLGEVQLADARFFHNSHAIALLSKNIGMYYPSAFTEASIQQIQRSLEVCIEIDEQDACDFVCNNIVVNQNVLVDNCSEKLERQLNEIGFNVIKLPMSEFKKTGASLRCLVLTL